MATTSTLIKQRKLRGYKPMGLTEADTRQSARAFARAEAAAEKSAAKQAARDTRKHELLKKQAGRKGKEQSLHMGPVSKGPQRTRRGPSLDQLNEMLAEKDCGKKVRTLHPTRGYRLKSFKSIEAERITGMMRQGIPGFSLAENRKAIQAFA